MCVHSHQRPLKVINDIIEIGIIIIFLMTTSQKDLLDYCFMHSFNFGSTYVDCTETLQVVCCVHEESSGNITQPFIFRSFNAFCPF